MPSTVKRVKRKGQTGSELVMPITVFIDDIIQIVIVFNELQYHMANLLEALRSRVANASEFHVH